MSNNETNKPTEGFYIEASFDRIIAKEKKDREGNTYKAYYVGVIVRTEDATSLYQLKTKSPELYAKYKSGDPLKVQVTPRAFKDFLYFTIVE